MSLDLGAHVYSPQERLDRASERLRSPAPRIVGELSFGIDLGTATCVLTAVDATGAPVYLDSVPCEALRDGVIVDFHGVVAAARQLKESAEAALGTPVEAAATAYPPGVLTADGKACAYALEQAGIDCRELLDEVSAANRMLGIEEGVVVDVGGGSTGIGVYERGAPVAILDIPGGGHHLDLILAGGLGITTEEARSMKHDRGRSVIHLLRPGIERVASRIATVTRTLASTTIHLIGGGLMIPGAADVVESYLGHPVVGYKHSLYVTPIGLAMEEI